MTKALLFLAILLTVSGCQVASDVYRTTTSGGAFSCDQIRSAFSAYEQDRKSAEAAAALSSMISVQTGEIGAKAITSSDSYYEKARENANLALIIKGCPPL